MLVKIRNVCLLILICLFFGEGESNADENDSDVRQDHGVVIIREFFLCVSTTGRLTYIEASTFDIRSSCIPESYGLFRALKGNEGRNFLQLTPLQVKAISDLAEEFLIPEPLASEILANPRSNSKTSEKLKELDEGLAAKILHVLTTDQLKKIGQAFRLRRCINGGLRKYLEETTDVRDPEVFEELKEWNRENRLFIDVNFAQVRRKWVTKLENGLPENESRRFLNGIPKDPFLVWLQTHAPNKLPFTVSPGCGLHGALITQRF